MRRRHGVSEGLRGERGVWGRMSATRRPGFGGNLVVRRRGANRDGLARHFAESRHFSARTLPERIRHTVLEPATGQLWIMTP